MQFVFGWYESQDAKENALIDFALAGLEQTIKAKPVYKTIKVDEPHIVKRTVWMLKLIVMISY